MPLFLLYLSNIGDIMAKSFKWIYAKVCLCRICPGVAKRREARNRRKIRTMQRQLREEYGDDDVSYFYICSQKICFSCFILPNFMSYKHHCFWKKIYRRTTIQWKAFQKHHNHHHLLRRQNHLKMIQIKKILRLLRQRAPIKTSALSQYRLVFV